MAAGQARQATPRQHDDEHRQVDGQQSHKRDRPHRKSRAPPRWPHIHQSWNALALAFDLGFLEGI
jgi:hypothetical protein